MKIHNLGRGFIAIALSAALIGSGCNANWVNIAVADVPVVLQIVTSTVTIVSIAEGKGADSNIVAEVTSIAAQAKTDVSTVQSLINDYNAAAANDKPGILPKIDAALTATEKDLQGILTAFHVKDTATQTAVAAGIGLALTTVEAIYSLVPAAPVTTAAMPTASHAKKSQPHKPRTPKELRTEYNALVGASFPDAVIQQ
jgi:hypothetical protein